MKKMKLIDIAKAHGAELLPAVDEEQIARFEIERGFELPTGLREFYLEAGGTGDFTQWSWRIWPFDELTTIESRAGNDPDIKCLTGYESCPVLSDYVAFIDVLIEAPLYAVCARPSNPAFGEVISLAGDSKPFLAGPIKTFEEFQSIFGRYWDDVLLPDTITSERDAGQPATRAESK